MTLCNIFHFCSRFPKEHGQFPGLILNFSSVISRIWDHEILKLFCDVSRMNRSMKNPLLCLHARTISSTWMLPRCLTDQQMWRMRMMESTRTLVHRLLPYRQVCVCCQLNVRPFTYETLIHLNVFYYSHRQRLWRPDVWPAGGCNLWLWRRFDTLSILHLHLIHLIITSQHLWGQIFLVSSSTQRLMTRSPSARTTSSPT